MTSKSGEVIRIFLLVILLVFAAPAVAASSFTVVIDAGHGGAEKGAVFHDIVEKDLCLRMAHALRSHLIKRPGMRVVMTREEDIAVSWEERGRIIEEAQPDLVVSLHFNTDIFMLSETRGIEIYYPADDFGRAPRDAFRLFDRNNRSFSFGKFLRDRYLRSPLFTEWKHDLNLFAKRDLKLFRITMAPAVLLELAYLTSADDRGRIASDAFLDAMARFLAETIAEWSSRK